MEACDVKIEKIENKGRALWVLGVFAREKEGTMHVRTCVRARAPPLAAPAPVLGVRVRVRGSWLVARGPWSVAWVPYLVLFESGSVGPPAEGFESPANGCPREQIQPFANRCRKTDQAVGRLIGCDGSVRTVATAGIWRTRIPLQSAIKSAPGVHSQTHQNSRSLSLFLKDLSLSLSIKF